MTDNINVIFQGDIALIEVGAVPSGAKVKKDKILAFGSATGHKHEFKDRNAKVYEVGGKLYAILTGDCQLFHDEHKQQKIKKGKYLVSRQREHDIVQGIRRVMD